jgi:hypothetical protein
MAAALRSSSLALLDHTRRRAGVSLRLRIATTAAAAGRHTSEASAAKLARLEGYLERHPACACVDAPAQVATVINR